MLLHKVLCLYNTIFFCPIPEINSQFYCYWLNLSHLWWIISCICFYLFADFFESIFFRYTFQAVLTSCTPRLPNRSLKSLGKAIEEEMEQEYLSEVACRLCPKNYRHVTGMLACVVTWQGCWRVNLFQMVMLRHLFFKWFSV